MNNMPPRITYRIANRESPGYRAVINGNFVEIGTFMGGFMSSAQACHHDPGGQRRQFDTLDEAAAGRRRRHPNPSRKNRR